MWTPAGPQTCHPEVSAQVAVEGAAGDSTLTVGTGWPQGLVCLHSGEILAEGIEGLLYLNALRSMVHLRLYQSYDFEVNERHAVWAAKFSS